MDHILNDLNGPKEADEKQKDDTTIDVIIASSSSITISQHVRSGNKCDRPPKAPKKGDKEIGVREKGQANVSLHCSGGSYKCRGGKGNLGPNNATKIGAEKEANAKDDCKRHYAKDNTENSHDTC